MVSRNERLSEAVKKAEEAKSIVEDLKDEMQNWMDGLTGTNLENSDKFSRIQDCVNQLEEVENNLDEAISSAESVEFVGAYS